MKRFAVLALCAVLFALVRVHAAAPVKPSIDFASADGVIVVTDALKPYHAPGAKPGAIDSGWYLITATNSSIRPSTRVFLAAQPPGVGFRLLPRRTRPQILGAASSDSLVVVTPSSGYGRHAYRITVPAATSVAIAMQLANTAEPATVLAWTEPALAQHNRQLAIYITAAWALIGAAALLVGGLAVTLGHAPARWAAITLGLVLLERLAETGLFDASIATPVGGPYGLMAMFSGLSLAAAAMLCDAIVPLHDVWPYRLRQFRFGVIGLCVLSVLAWFGIPAAAVLTDIVVVLGTPALAAYLIWRARLGAQAARVAAPSAVVFALVGLASALAVFDGSIDSMALSVAGGFAAAGSLLLALAVAAGEGIAVLPFQSVAAHPEVEPAPREAPAGGGFTSAAALAIGASHQGVFDLDFDAEVVKLGREAAMLLGLPQASAKMSHDDWLDRIHVEDRDVYVQALDDYRSHPGVGFRIEFRVRSETGRHPWLELRATMQGERTPSSRCLGLLADVTVRKESESEKLQRTLRDPLTGLGNRVALMEVLETLGPHLASATFVLLDVDRFKSIHASLGDAGGDDLLMQMAERLTRSYHGVAQVFRVGGDAFALVFGEAVGELAAVGREILDVCAAPYTREGRSVFAPASVAVAAGRDAHDPLDLLKNAELALLQAKRAGGTCVRVYSRELEMLAPGDAVALETDLRRAVEDGQLDVYYQPIVRLADNKIAGFEALLRWNHPSKGVISPSDFIAHSEETGSIVALGRFALERAAHEMAQWQRFFPLDPPLFVSVNVSRRQLRDEDFVVFLGGLLQQEGVAPGTLKLEVTESTVAANQDVRAALERCRALGAGISIDDFGTGVSSLSQLKTLPFDTIKIDQSFLARHAGLEADGETILKSIIDLAHGLKRTVVVEGVETANDAAWLEQLGCAYGQGFFYARPLPSAQALQYIALHFDVKAEQK